MVLLAILAVALTAAFVWTRERSKDEPMAQSSDYVGTITAPEFPDGLAWLNTKRPLTLRELRGKVVVLDFWTYCCINCMHVIPELKKVEKQFEKEVVVIGVHTAKFPTEKETENIRQAILRYEIEHPVVNDRSMAVWNLYAARAWPTIVVIDPQGKIVAQASGEISGERLGAFVAEVIKTFDAKKLVKREPLKLELERGKVPTSVLSFPGKVLADQASNRLFISDSNHNRIVVLSLADNSVLDVIGGGEIGLKDDEFEAALFNHPQGMALDGEMLYIADTENHAIRRADLKTRKVQTLAGTGEQARFRTVGGFGPKAELNSPWDLIVFNNALYIAMAGPHQLWKMDLKTLEVGPYAGSGAEGRRDGKLLDAALAQPSGITTDGQRLYFADSEVSSIRAADLDPSGRVDTIVGEDLFEFGDKDGVGSRARLQHPLGVVYYDGILYVADTYNNKIKKVSPTTRNAQSYLGVGEPGLRDGEKPLFDEPAGVSIANNKLYIADTNNHVIRVADLKTGRVTTLEIKGVEKLRPKAKSDAFTGELIQVPTQTVAPGKGMIKLSLELPKDHKLNEGAPSRLVLTTSSGVIEFGDGQSKLTVQQPQFPLELPINVKVGETRLAAEMTLYYCRSGMEGLCYFKEARIEAPITVKADAANSSVGLSYTIK
jgi:DNA-binding beta-propeller fold protein YncE